HSPLLLQLLQQPGVLALVVCTEPHRAFDNAVTDVPAAKLHDTCAKYYSRTAQERADPIIETHHSEGFTLLRGDEDRIRRSVSQVNPIPQAIASNRVKHFG